MRKVLILCMALLTLSCCRKQTNYEDIPTESCIETAIPETTIFETTAARQPSKRIPSLLKDVCVSDGNTTVVSY